MSWLEKLLPSRIEQTDPTERRSVPEGLWTKCPACDAVLFKTDLEHSQMVCPKCGHHHRIGARSRLNAFLDAEGRYEIGQEVIPVDALKFKDSRKYPDRLKQAMNETGETDALIVMGGAIHSLEVVVAIPIGPIHRELRVLAMWLIGLTAGIWTAAALLGRWLCGAVDVVAGDRVCGSGPTDFRSLSETLGRCQMLGGPPVSLPHAMPPRRWAPDLCRRTRAPNLRRAIPRPYSRRKWPRWPA